MIVLDWIVQANESEEWARALELERDVLASLDTAEIDIQRALSESLAKYRAKALEELHAAQALAYETTGIQPASLRNGHVSAPEITYESAMSAAINSKVEHLDLHAMLLEDDEPIEWIWGDDEQGYIERGTVCCFHGFGGLGKSMLTGALALAITSGTDLLGQPCKRGRVLMIDAENPRKEIKRRVKRLGLDPGRTRYIRAKSPILAPGFADWLAYEINEHAATLVVLDSQRALQPGDEKEALAMRTFYTEVANVAEETNCAIVVVHHDNKGKDFSGSTDIDACVSWRWHLYADQKDDTIVYFKQAKGRGAKKLRTVQIVIRFEGMRLSVEVGDKQPHGAIPLKKASAEDIAMWIRRQTNQDARASDIRHEFDISDGTLRSRRGELERLGIRYQDAGQLSVYHAVPNPRTSGELRT